MQKLIQNNFHVKPRAGTEPTPQNTMKDLLNTLCAEGSCVLQVHIGDIGPIFRYDCVKGVKILH